LKIQIPSKMIYNDCKIKLNYKRWHTCG